VAINNTQAGFYVAQGADVIGCASVGNEGEGIYYSSNYYEDREARNNTIMENQRWGIFLDWSCYGVTVHNNNFIDNNIPGGQTQAYDGNWVEYVLWNSTEGGNHWSEWTSPDDDGDGFVDIPYSIYSWDGSQDNMPLVEPVEELSFPGDKTAWERKTFVLEAEHWEYLLLGDITFDTNASWLELAPDLTISGMPDPSHIGKTYYANVTITLMDPNYQKVATRKVKTNSFGTASGEFVIPSGRLLGQWQMRSSLNGSSWVRVEEYKRPTFEAKLLDPKDPLRLNKKATLKGEARYYFGLPVTTGKVRWRSSGLDLLLSPTYARPSFDVVEIKNAGTRHDLFNHGSCGEHDLPLASVGRMARGTGDICPAVG